MPHRIAIGDRGLKENMVEYRARCAEENENIGIDNIVDKILTTIK